MRKSNSGTQSATGLTGSGVRDWMVQRISAVVLAVYSVVMVGFFLFNDVTYESWTSFMMSLPMRLFSLLAILSLAGHAWVGLWTTFTDYITTSKVGPAASGIRLVLQALMILSIFVFIIWGINIFWGI